jgi:hypothetical protein
MRGEALSADPLPYWSWIVMANTSFLFCCRLELCSPALKFERNQVHACSNESRVALMCYLSGYVVSVCLPTPHHATYDPMVTVKQCEFLLIVETLLPASRSEASRFRGDGDEQFWKKGYRPSCVYTCYLLRFTMLAVA